MRKKILVAVAHPDDETLWCGGLLLKNPRWEKTIFSFTRESDEDRNPKFFSVCNYFNAVGAMGNLDDSPEQKPLSYRNYEEEILKKVACKEYDIILTHNPFGEYTRHLRHEEASMAIIGMLAKENLTTKELWLFNYSDNQKKEFPNAKPDSDLILELEEDIILKKETIIKSIYGFSEESWEFQANPKIESFKIIKNFF